MDERLGDLFAADRVEETVAAILAQAEQPTEPPELREARRTMADTRQRLARHVAAIEAGVDPALMATRTREAQAALAQAEAIIAGHQARPGPTVHTLRELLTSMEAWPRLPAVATPEERRQLYDGAGVRLEYRRAGDGSETVRATVSVGFYRVGEGT